MNKLMLLVCFSSVCFAQVNILPLAQDNAWTLRNQYISDTVALSVTSDQMMGPKRRVVLAFRNPWFQYDLILNVVSNGTLLEGIVQDGATMHFDNTSYWFRTDVSAGASWLTPLGPMKLLSKTATVTTSSARYSNCWKYVFGTGEQAQYWYLAPNIGFVQFGESPASFVLSSKTLNPYVAPVPSTLTGPCPKLGIHPNPAANGDFSDAGLEAVLANTVVGGVRMYHADATWAALEPTPGTYQTDKLDNALKLAQKYKLDIALTIRTIDTNVMALPPDLVGRTTSDPVVISRFNALLTALAPIMNSNVRWVHFGNEVNLYFVSRPAELPAFQTFVAAAAARLKALKPGVSTGVVFAYPGFRATDQYVKPLIPSVDHVAFTYYPIKADYSMYDPSVAAADIAEMVAGAAGKPLLLTEIGYTSKAPSSTGTSAQRTFYSNALNAIAKYSGKIVGASFITLNDPPPSIVASLTSYYGILAPNFEAYLAGLGLADSIGVAKPAYSVWVTQSQSFGANVGCTIP